MEESKNRNNKKEELASIREVEKNAMSAIFSTHKEEQKYAECLHRECEKDLEKMTKGYLSLIEDKKEFKSELKMSNNELKESVEEIERERCQNVVILVRLEELEKSNKLL